MKHGFMDLSSNYFQKDFQYMPWKAIEMKNHAKKYLHASTALQHASLKMNLKIWNREAEVGCQ